MIGDCRAHAAVLRKNELQATDPSTAALPEASSSGEPGGTSAAETTGAGGGPGGSSGSSRSETANAGVLAYDHYQLLRLPSDFTAEQLRRAYKAASLRAHPDRGGSADAFAAVAAAHETLRDPTTRAAFDAGNAVNGEHELVFPGNLTSVLLLIVIIWAYFDTNLVIIDGAEGHSLEESIEREYFPERFGFELFGDPLEKKRKWEAKQRRKAEAERGNC